MSKPENPPLFWLEFQRQSLDEPPSYHPVTDIGLRDLFAAAALAGMNACSTIAPDFIENEEEVAGRCYEMADAMLAEREKRDGD